MKPLVLSKITMINLTGRLSPLDLTRSHVVHFAILASSLMLTLTFSFNCPSFAKESKMDAEIKSLLQMQADAWNAGNLDKFMSGYLQSNDVCFTAGGEEVWGYDAINARYKARYGNSSAGMGKLFFSELKIIRLSDTNALCIGHFNVQKEDQTQIGGVFSLVIVKRDGAWRILHDHTSVFKPAS